MSGTIQQVISVGIVNASLNDLQKPAVFVLQKMVTTIQIYVSYYYMLRLEMIVHNIILYILHTAWS